MHKTQDMPARRPVLKFFDWAYKNGDKMAADLEYVPLPERQGLIASWAEDQGRFGQAGGVQVNVTRRWIDRSNRLRSRAGGHVFCDSPRDRPDAASSAG